jgi:hypothetical protein
MEFAPMSSHPISHEELQEAYNVGVLRQNESSLARCYLQLHEAARNVCANGWPGCDQDKMAAIELLRKMIS